MCLQINLKIKIFLKHYFCFTQLSRARFRRSCKKKHEHFEFIFVQNSLAVSKNFRTSEVNQTQ